MHKSKVDVDGAKRRKREEKDTCHRPPRAEQKIKEGGSYKLDKAGKVVAQKDKGEK